MHKNGVQHKKPLLTKSNYRQKTLESGCQQRFKLLGFRTKRQKQKGLIDSDSIMEPPQ